MVAFLKRLTICLSLISCFQFGFSQNVQINPSVKWKMILTHDISFESGNFIFYEFPAEKNYDYIFNITHNQDSLHAVIMIYDMQDQLVRKMILEDNKLSIDLGFDVASSGTYKVVLGLTDPKKKKGQPIDSHLILMRREKV